MAAMRVYFRWSREPNRNPRPSSLRRFFAAELAEKRIEVRRKRIPLRLSKWLSVVCLVCACGGSQSSAPAAADSKSAVRSSRVDEISQVDVSELTQAEKSLWVDMVNDQLSPCGDPQSVAKCASEQRKCGACVTAARYSRAARDRRLRSRGLADQYRTRFNAQEKRDISLEDSPSRGAPMAKVTIVEF